MSKPMDHLSNASLHAMLDYLQEEIKLAQTQKDLEVIVSIAREMLTPSPLQNAVSGLGHIRAEVDHDAIARARRECTVRLNIPQVLSETFQNLSARMRTLQNEDPDTFTHASNALTWLANGEIKAAT